MLAAPIRWLLSVIVLFFSLANCQDEGLLVVEISVDGLEAGIRVLEVTMDLDGQPALGGTYQVARRLDRFLVQLPHGSVGRLTLQISGVGSDGCQIALGEGSVVIAEPMRYPLEIQLDQKEAGCRLVVEKVGTGSGTVTSDPEGIRCGAQCEATFAPGTEVRLSASVDTYFGGWFGACMGRGECRVTGGSGITSVTAHFIRSPNCTSARWCAEEGLPPLTNDLNSVWGSGPTSVWAVGNGGVILRGDGVGWTKVQSGTTGRLNAVWGSGPRDVWVVGDGGIVLRWQGAEWDPVQSGTASRLNAVWGSGPRDVWVVGDGGFILRWDGTAWGRVPATARDRLNGIWGSGPDDVWAAGENGAVLRWSSDGTQRQSLKMGRLNAVWGSGPRDVWAVGEAGTVLRWRDGARDAEVVVSGTLMDLFGIWGSGANDAWAVGDGSVMLRWNGTTWQTVEKKTASPLTAIWGSGSNYVWAVGRMFTVLRYRP